MKQHISNNLTRVLDIFLSFSIFFIVDILTLLLKHIRSARFFLGGKKLFIKQGCLKLIKIDSQDICNFTQDLYCKQMLFF